MHVNKLLFHVLSGLLFAVLLFANSGVVAEEKINRDGVWASIDAGLGYIERSFETGNENDTNLYLGFTVGYVVAPHFLIGLEMSGWLLEASNLNYPEQGGEGLSQVFVVARYYPYNESGLHLKLGGGYTSHWNNRPDEPRRTNGWGMSLGLGYDLDSIADWSIVPFLDYSFGDTDNQDYQAITLGLGFTWY